MRPKIALVICLMLTCALAAAAQDSSQTQIQQLETAVGSGTATRAEQLELARHYLDAGRHYDASKIARRLLDADANDKEAMTLRDDAARALRDAHAQQVADAEAKANREGSTDADRLALADAYFDAGRYDEAATAYAKLSLDREGKLRRARALAWSHQMDAAERVYTDVLKESTTPDVELEYGRLLSWMGASRAATETLQRSYDTLHNEESAIALANAYAWNGDRERAIVLLDDYTKNNPQSPEASRVLAELRNSPELPIERLDKQIAAEPFNLALRVQKARLLNAAGHFGEALKEIRFVHEHTSANLDDVDALEREIKLRRESEIARLNDDLSHLKDTPSDPQRTLSLAHAYTGVDDYDRAIDLYADYLRARPDDVEARIAYARVLSWDKRWSASEREYQRILKDNPDRADIKLEYAQVLSYDADYARALPMFSSLTDLSSNPRAHLYADVPPRAHYNLGQIYRWYGWQEHAIEHQNMALSLDSGYLPAREELDLARHTRPSSNLQATYTNATDSDDFTIRRVDLEGEMWRNGRMAVSASVGRHNFEHAGTDVSANSVSGGLAYRTSDRWTVRGRVGATLYDEGLGTRPFWGIGAQWIPNIQSRAAFDYNRYDLVYDVFTLQSLLPVSGPGVRIDDPVSIDDFRAHYDWNSGGLLSALGDASYGFISDDNHRMAAHGIVAFRLWKSPFVAVKADGRILRYDFRTNRYWSPDDYNSLAGVLQVGDNVRDRFFWTAELKYGRAWEGNTESDLRSYTGRITVPVGDSIDLVGSWGYGRSGRLESILGNTGTDFVNYWQRQWYVGVRLKRLFASDDRRGSNPYYYDNRSVSGSPL